MLAALRGRCPRADDRGRPCPSFRVPGGGRARGRQEASIPASWVPRGHWPPATGREASSQALPASGLETQLCPPSRGPASRPVWPLRTRGLVSHGPLQHSSPHPLPLTGKLPPEPRRGGQAAGPWPLGSEMQGVAGALPRAFWGKWGCRGLTSQPGAPNSGRPTLRPPRDYRRCPPTGPVSLPREKCRSPGVTPAARRQGRSCPTQHTGQLNPGARDSQTPDWGRVASVTGAIPQLRRHPAARRSPVSLGSCPHCGQEALVPSAWRIRGGGAPHGRAPSGAAGPPGTPGSGGSQLTGLSARAGPTVSGSRTRGG